MKNRKLENYLRTHRRKAGLSQRQLGQLLGYTNEAQVSRHERSQAVPLLVIAFGYQVIFRVPASSLFPRIYEDARQAIEERLGQLEINLHGQTVRGHEAEAIAQTLMWMMERREQDTEIGDAG